MPKRVRKVPVPNDGQVIVKYGRSLGEDGIYYCVPPNVCGMKADSRVICEAFERTILSTGRTLFAELEARGYDIKTVLFGISKKNDA